MTRANIPRKNASAALRDDDDDDVGRSSSSPPPAAAIPVSALAPSRNAPDRSRRQNRPLHLLVHRVLYRGLEAQYRVGLDALVESTYASLGEHGAQEGQRAPILGVGLDGRGEAIDGQGHGKVGPLGHAAEDEVGEGADVGIAGQADVPVFVVPGLGWGGEEMCVCIVCLLLIGGD